MAEITIIIAFIAGLASFLSPCVLPLIPGFLAYLSGVTITESKDAKAKIFLNSLSFVVGLSTVFALLGVLLNTLLESISYTLQEWLARISGTIIIMFALYILKLIRIPWLEQEHKIKVKKHFSSTYLTSFIFGAAFAVGWTPCVGAVLGSVLALAATQPETSFVLLLSYALGLGIPFLFVGMFTAGAMTLIKRYSGLLRYFNIIVGILLLIIGILVFTNTLSMIASLEFISGFLKR